MPRKPVEIPDLKRLPFGGAETNALDWAAAAFGLVWLLGVGIYVWLGLSPAGVIGMAMTALVVVLPLGLAWFSLGTLKAIQALRDEARQLQDTVDAMRVSSTASQQQSQAAASQRPVERGPDRSRDGADASVPFSSRRDGALTVPSADRKSTMLPPRPAPAGEEQPGLALGTPMEDPQSLLTMEDFLRAIHFPEGPEDKAGFRALRLALTDRTTAKLIRAAQDVLTLLAQEGIYMDDLSPDRARPELWRHFAAGERGRTIAGLGGVRDRSCLALTASRMREDAVFRDAAHHFLRSFDKAVAAIEPRASDAELSFLSDTRTARAFMLFGRVTGTFD